MIEHRGDISTVAEGLIIHQVNCQGVMGSGVAKALKEKYPQMYEDYYRHAGQPFTQLEEGRYLLGDVVYTQVTEDLAIACLFGQQYFGRDGRRYTSYDAQEIGLKTIRDDLRDHPGIKIHVPLLGAGLGGGDWSITQAIIHATLGPDVNLWIL